MPALKSKLKLYLGTDVLLSMLKGEEADGKKLGDNVARLLSEAADGKYQVIVSEHTARELLDAGVPKEYVNQMLRPLLLLGGSDLLVTNTDIIRAALKDMRLYEMPFMQALHVVFAGRNSALVVTRDLTFINKARSLVGVMTPEELLSF